jgi:hypothetical protein
MHTGGGGIKVDPPFKVFAKLVIKNAMKPQKDVPTPQNLAKTSRTLPLDFQTVCTCGEENFFCLKKQAGNWS